MPCGTLTNIALDCAPDIGGISKIFVKEIGDSVIAASDTNGAVAITAIDVDGTALVADLTGFTEIELAKEVGSIVDTATPSAAAGTVFFSCVVSAVANGSSATNLETLKAMATSKRLMAIVRDNNNNYWLIGNDKGCVLTTGSNQTGTAYTDLSGLSFELTGTSGSTRWSVTGITE